ncbi:DUF262 domain-containing protein [Pararhizobium sp. DWP3-4]|uniref:DUF262 domain-containing protein n=1 Tax=Pararhizobium sp. DWP3-4 TaxID=2804565 RepID=UPI003CE9FEFF
MQLNPMHLKVSTLLTGRLFRIPEYQRAYAWGPRQRSDLFHDILDAKISGREHFMATVVALSKGDRLIGADQFRTVEIVDGQQRITTLVILFKAIVKALNVSDAVQEKIWRDISELLVKGDDHSLVLLQTNHDSSSVFTDYIRAGAINEDQAKTASDMNLIHAARECEAFVRDWLLRFPIVELVAVVKNQLSMIYHEIPDEATVYRVFEVLNSRGLDVKWIDKLKSQLMALLFEHVEPGTRQEAVKEMQEIWKQIYQALGQRGNLGDESLRFAGTWSLGQQPNRIISQEDSASALTIAAGVKLNSVIVVGENLKRVVQAVNALDGNVRLRAVTKIVHARFVATAILLRRFDADVERRLLGTWERVTFRIFGLGGADTRHKIGDYVRLGYKIIADNLDVTKIEAGLADLGTNYDIANVLKAKDYWNQSYEGWTEELRYILFRYDEHLAAAAGSPLNELQWNKIWLEEPSRSVEHVMPQSSGAAYIHNIGNLTMLPPRVNSSLQATSPVAKASVYQSSGLLGTAAIAVTITTNNGWDETDVDARTTAIDAFVRSEWG